MAMAENTVLLFSLIGIWLVAAMVYDFRKHKKEANESAA
jgi:cbb3-type cytochrome oxidase subunit 3